MSTKRSKQCINRKIYFYKIYAGTNGANMPIQYDAKKALENIDNLSFQTDARYLKDEDDDVEICCWIDEISSPQKVIFGKIRRDDLPQIELKGKLTDLSIPEESGLVECVHVMFFPENIVGIEYNYDGPKVSAISNYLHVKSQGVCSWGPVFEHLLQTNAIERLEHFKTIRQFRLKVRESLFSSTEKANEYLAKALAASRELGHPREIELTLSVGRSGGTLGKTVQDMAKKLLGLKDTNNDVISGEVKGYNEKGKIEIIDLLSSKLVAQKCIPRSKNRNSVPQGELVFLAIEEAYNELKDQLINAVGVTLCTV